MPDILKHDMSEPQAVVDAQQAEEADSLRIGEELQAEQQQLLAGKYKDAEELEKAYLELQGKLGEPKPEEKPQETEAEVTPEQIVNDYLNWDGKVPEDLQKAYDNLSREQIRDAMKGEPKEEQEQEIPDLTDKQVQDIHGLVGGEAQYSELVKWAANNMSKAEIEAFDNVVESADMNTINFAVQALYYRYQEANGVDGMQIQGKSSGPSVRGYRSQAELIAAMSDPRYETDPAYRSDVMEKLSQSEELQF